MPSKPAGNSNQTTTTNSTQEVKLPQWVTDASQSILGQAQQTAGNLQPAVAPLTAGQLAGIQSLWDTQSLFQPQYQAAQQGAQNVIGFTPQQVTPGLLSQTDLTAYMNPYTQSVIDPSMKLLDQQRQQANNQTADLAAKTGAFGGSRQGVTEGVTNAQSALLGGQLGAQLNSANFLNAQQQAQADLARSLQGQALNQQAGIQGAGLNLSAANALGQLTQMGSADNLQRQLAALQAQGLIQGQQQQELSATRQNPIDQLQVLLSAIGGIPYGHTQTGQGTQTGMGPTSNPSLTALGGLSSLAGTAGQIGGLFATGGVFGPAAAAAAAVPALAASDRRLKTDIEKLGEDPDTGLPMYSYRYKGDPKTYPKVVGPMAQDIQKKYPDQVAEIGGKLAVRIPFLEGLLGRSDV